MPYYGTYGRPRARGFLNTLGRTAAFAASGTLARRFANSAYNMGSNLLKPYPTRAGAFLGRAIGYRGGQARGSTYARRGFQNRRAGFGGTPELKFVDTASSTYAADGTGTIAYHSLVAQGDDVNARQGRVVRWKNIHLKGLLYPQDSVTLGNMARLMVIWDKQNNSSAGALEGDLVVNTGTSITFKNLTNRERFVILRDISFPQGSTNDAITASVGAVSQGNNTHLVDEYIDLSGYKTVYSGTTATIQAIASGNIIIYTTGSQAAGNGGNFSIAVRERFYDS